MRAGGLHPLGALVALAACSAPAPPPDLARAERHERAGKDDEALASYETAVGSCGRERDPERRRRWCSAAMLGRAAALERLERKPEAAAAYEVIARAGLEAPETEARGLTAAGRLRLELGQEKEGYALLWRVLVDYPDTSSADEALRLVVRDGRKRDPARLATVLWELYRRLGRSALADNLLAALAEVNEEDLRRPEEARKVYDLLAETYPKSTLWDDAVWHAARLAAGAGDLAGAERRYRALLARRESSFLVGSYNSVWMDDARLALAILLRDRLNRPQDAARELELLPEHFPDSVLRDDALYELAVTRLALGDAARACAALSALKQGHPDSKYRLERAPRLAARAGCR